MPTCNLTPPAIFRTVELYRPTLLIDEADTFIKSDKHVLRGIINSGHTRTSSFVMRIVGVNNEPKQFSTWCAKCIAGIGNLPDTITDRSIRIKLHRKTVNEKVERLRYKDEQKFLEIKQKLLRFSKDYFIELKNSNPAIPEGLNDRATDNWEPLFAIADIAGEPWSSLARKASLAINGHKQEHVSVPIQLLIDIKKIFTLNKVNKISSANLVSALCSDEIAPWRTYNQGTPLTQSQLAKKLGTFEIKSKDIRVSKNEVLKGYYRKSFDNAFSRYIPIGTDATAQQSNIHAVLRAKSSATLEPLLPIENHPKSFRNGACSAVADRCANETENQPLLSIVNNNEGE